MKEKMERCIHQNISLPLSLRDRVLNEAERRGISISRLIRVAITREIQGKKMQESENESE